MAVRFSASGQNYTRSLSLGSQTQWTVSCWVKITTDRNAYSTVWGLDDGSTLDYYILQTDADGTTILLLDDADNTFGSRALTVGTWYYVGVSVNGANGTMVSRAAGDTSFTVSTWTTAAASTSLQNFRLGDAIFTDEWLNGCLAAVKVWSGATLTQAELEAEAWTYQPRRTAGLQAWYPLTRAETTDYSGNGRTLSGGSGATTEDGPGIAWRQGRRRIHRPLSVPAEATPGLVTGSTSIPTPAVSIGRTVAPSLITGTVSIPAPDIFTGDSPPTNVQPGIIHGSTVIPAPGVSTVKNVTATPALLVARAVIPTPAVSVPINPGDDLTGPGQLSYNGFKMGGGTPYSWQLLTGWWVDMPALDNGDVPHPSAHGAMAGQKLSQARIVTYESLIKAPKTEIEQAAMDFLAGLPVPDADEQLPLAVRVLDRILIGYGACTARAAPLDKLTRLGHLRATAQFTLARPELYSRELLSATVADGGFVEVFNAGNTRTQPLIRCPGPANGPELVVERILPDGSTDLRVLGFDLEIGPTETLIIDPFNSAASIGGVSKLRSRTGASVAIPDFVLGPKGSEISYSTAEGGAPPATVLWRHAHL
ncbi:LamG-like jellyroll fold domain-containing protein [Streptosporangium sp. NPDC051022]|uniref:LamG-like jellyroll fold domain-containing protein n=1 Tax=Streptosporangium sp. NPDC051022 TaxID=3155752 RepID=UPI003440AFB7